MAYIHISVLRSYSVAPKPQVGGTGIFGLHEALGHGSFSIPKHASQTFAVLDD
jgi:hypothetical protein